MTAVEVDVTFAKKELRKPRYRNISIQEPIKESMEHLEAGDSSNPSPTQTGKTGRRTFSPPQLNLIKAADEEVANQQPRRETVVTPSDDISTPVSPMDSLHIPTPEMRHHKISSRKILTKNESFGMKSTVSPMLREGNERADVE